MSRARRRSKNQISGQFVARLVEILESPAYRVLSLSAHRVLSRIEVEQAHHGGNDNGKLPVTYENFQKYGIDRDAIAPALRELCALGFVEITQRGCAGNAEFRRPNHYLLTYLPADAQYSLARGWRRFETFDEAHKVAVAARAARGENRSPVGENRLNRSGKPRLKSKIPAPENPDHNQGRETPTTSISRVGSAVEGMIASHDGTTAPSSQVSKSGFLLN